MATTIKSRQQLPDIAKPTADLIEKFGFQWELNYEYPVAELDTTRRVQIRDEKHNAPTTMVTLIATAMERGEKLPPIIVTRDGYVVDGNTRLQAAKRNKYPTIQALVLDVSFEGISSAADRRLRALGAGFNARHGKGIDREEIREAVEHLSSDGTYDAVKIAALIGVTEGTAQNILAEHRARTRAEKLGLPVNGSLTASQLRLLGKRSASLHDQPFREVFRLTQDTGMTTQELGHLTKTMKEAESDDAALRAIEEERVARREQMATFKASGKSKPPLSAMLRQRLGWVNSQDDPRQLIEYNASVATKHLDQIAKAITVLEAVAGAQRELTPQLPEG